MSAVIYVHPTRGNAFDRACAIARHPAGRMYRKADGPFGGYADRITGERVNRMVGTLPVPTR